LSGWVTDSFLFSSTNGDDDDDDDDEEEEEEDHGDRRGGLPISVYEGAEGGLIREI